MGFGYNGTLVSLGERLEMLDFFSWMKKLQDKGVQEWTIWDASGYFIVNKLPAKKLIGLGSQPSASLILEALVEEQERPKRAEIKENCDLRSQYLQRLIQMTGVKAKYLNSWQVFREDSRYAEAVDVALEFVKRLEKDLPDLCADRIDYSLTSAAETLGADAKNVFLRIELPLIRGAVFSALTFSFAISLGELGLSFLLFEGTWVTMPIYIYRFISSYNLFGAAAMGLVLITISTLCFYLIEKFNKEFSVV